MITHAGLEKYFNWLLDHSWQAGLLVLLVLLVQWVFRRQLTSRWRFALWWIVLLRLLLPFSPESAISLFNVVHPAIRLGAPLPPAPTTSITPAKIDTTQAAAPALEAAPPPPPPIQIPPARETPAVVITLSHPNQSAPPASGVYHWLPLGLMILWSAGALGLTGVVAVQLIRFHRKLAQATRLPA
jgi:beta-lactamase regulating signal transducer with metallopeptidase domain